MVNGFFELNYSFIYLKAKNSAMLEDEEGEI